MKTRIAAAFCAMMCLSASALENEFWLSSVGPTNAYQNGTQYYPWRCPDAVSLSRIFSTQLNRKDITIHFAPGLYIIPANTIAVKDGWVLRGAGWGNTTLQYQSNSLFKGITSVIRSPDWEHRNRVEISDFTIDLNFATQSNTLSVGAIQMSGSNLRYSRIKTVNWATRTPELFVLLMGSDELTQNVNNVIEDCIVTQPAMIKGGRGVSGIAFVTDGNVVYGKSRGAIARNNYIYGVTAGTGGIGSPEYFHGIAGDCGNGMITGNYFYDLVGIECVGIYRDSYNGRDTVISGNVMDNVWSCIYYNMTQSHMTDVSIINNVLRPSENGVGVAYYAGEPDATNTNAFAANLLLMGNVIYPSSGSTNVRTVMLVTRKPNVVQGNYLRGAGDSSQPRILTPTTGTNVFGGNIDFPMDPVVSDDLSPQ